MDSNEVSSNFQSAFRHNPVVILVEDDDGLRVALGRVLRASGFATRAYGSAEALLQDVPAHAADCLVVDLELPAMSGLDLVARLRQEGVQTPAVAISARDEASVREAVRRRGIERFLGKPFLGSLLVGTVNELLAGHQPRPCTKGQSPLPQ